jgi:hypothetical protein
MIPGESNGGASTFPSVSIGQPLSSLTTAQQNLALAVIQLYVGDMDAATESYVMTGYTNEINQTYISYHGNGSSGNQTSFLTAQGDYMRISGPNVWIEFSCQGGVVIPGQIHYHTVWRDRSHDYGVNLTGGPIDVPNTTPLHLISFIGGFVNETPILRWISTNEDNILNFEVEQSTSSSGGFTTAGQVQAKNTPGENRYQFYPLKPISSGIIYYRLKITDRDRSFRYSPVVSIHYAMAGIKILNTVADNSLFIQLPSTFTAGMYKIVSLSGQLLLTGIINGSMSSTSINVEKLKRGQYIIAVENDNNKYSAKFFKK